MYCMAEPHRTASHRAATLPSSLSLPAHRDLPPAPFWGPCLPRRVLSYCCCLGRRCRHSGGGCGLTRALCSQTSTSTQTAPNGWRSPWRESPSHHLTVVRTSHRPAMIQLWHPGPGHMRCNAVQVLRPAERARRLRRTHCVRGIGSTRGLLAAPLVSRTSCRAPPPT